MNENHPLLFPALRALREGRRLLGRLPLYPGYSWPVHLLTLLPLAIVTGGVGLVHGWWGEPVRLTYEAARNAHPVLTDAMSAVSFWGGPLLHAVYFALLARGFLELRRTAADAGPAPETRAVSDLRLGLRYAFFSLVITLLLGQMLKHGLGMPRPGFPWPPQPLAFSMYYNSFPSGHTTEVVAAALPLAVRSRRLTVRVALALLAALVGYSRIWLGRHHPVDIIAGMALGSLAARLIFCPTDASRA